jgi:hypothetical protein
MGAETLYAFEYGTSISYGLWSEAGSIAAGATSPVKVAQALSSLEPATTYHYRLVALSENGISYGVDQTLTTASGVTTSSASKPGASTATLNGTIVPGSQETSYQFEFGTNTSYGFKSPASPKAIGSGFEEKAASEEISGLSPATTYHYRLVASNAKGNRYGSDETFTTWGSWSTQTTVNPAPLTKASLESVSCASSSMCFAVGNDGVGAKNLVHRWTGSEWKSMASKEGTLSDVSCPSATTCSTVGESNGAPSSEWWLSVGGTWLNGTKSVATPEGGSAVRLKDVSCSSATACTAVGSYYNGTRTVTLAERSTSETGGWSVQTTANPESGDAELLGVSCDSASSCTAVGWQGSKTFAERWNGTSWSTVSTPNPSPSVESVLRKVSCTSSTNCMAVGYYRESSSGTANNKKALAERWNGTSWSIVSSPNPAEAKGTSLLDVSCASSSSCIAVGRYVSATPKGLEYEAAATEEKTLVEFWGGSEWQIQSSPNPEGKKFSKLAGVSCSASNACTAVGSGIQGSETTTLGEQYK